MPPETLKPEECFTTNFSQLTDMQDFVGHDLGLTDWITIDQERVDLFAQATDDHQWIHVDPEKARRLSPFPGTIAHGFLLLSLAPRICYETFQIEDVVMGLNYGLDRVRFPQAVPTGSRVRGRTSLVEYIEIPGGARFKVKVTIEVQGEQKPACIAEFLSQVYTAS